MQSKTKVIQQETAPRQQSSIDTEWEDQPYASTSSDEEVPEEISARVLRRILIFSGIPTFTGFLSLPLFYYLKARSACSHAALSYIRMKSVDTAAHATVPLHWDCTFSFVRRKAASFSLCFFWPGIEMTLACVSYTF